MIDERIKEVLSRRSSLHPEDSISAERCWEEESEILSRNVEESIDFFENRCTGEEFVWLSEVFEDVLEQTQSDELRCCLLALAKKYPEETEEYNILEFIPANDESER